MSSYKVVDIAHWFHSFPHLGKDLKPISNTTFDPQSEQYVTSLAVYVGLPIALMIFILVLYLLMTIIMCCCCSNGNKPKNIRIECKVFIFLFGLVCGLSFISGLYGDWQMYEGIKSIQNSSQHAVNWVNDIKHNSNRVVQAFNLKENVGDLKNNIQELKKTLPSDQLDQYIRQCDQIINFLGNSESTIVNANKTLEKAKYDDVPEYVDKYGTIFCITVVCILSTMAIIGLVFTFAICSRCVLGCFTVLAVISFILSGILVGAGFGLSVGGSDFCLDDKHWMRSMIKNKDISDYLIDCVSNNVVNNYMSDATGFVGSATNIEQKLNKDLKAFLDNCPSGSLDCKNTKDKINNNLIALNSNLTFTSNLITEFAVLSKCENFNNDLNDTLESICTDVLKGVVMIYFNTIVASLCFAIIVFSATFALR